MAHVCNPLPTSLSKTLFSKNNHYETQHIYPASPTFWLCAAGLGVLSLATPMEAQAQPAPQKEKRQRGNGKRIPKKMNEALEAKLGKPVTPEQREQILAAMAARNEAMKAAREKYVAEVAKITGLTTEETQAIITPPRANKEDAAN